MRNVASFILKLKVYGPCAVGFFVCLFYTFDSVIKYSFSAKKFGRREGFVLIEPKGLGVF